MDTYALDDKVQARRRKRRRALLAILLSSSLATLGAGAMSLAIFTDTEATDGAWSTGSIILGVAPNATFTVNDILPGDVGDQDITVSNTGTGDLRYAMTSAATDPDGLLAQMTFEIFAGTCAAPGASLYSGSIAAAALGSTAVGPDAGDRDVLAGASDDLCFRWELPLATGNAFQLKTGSSVFTFAAEQTLHNP